MLSKKMAMYVEWMKASREDDDDEKIREITLC